MCNGDSGLKIEGFLEIGSYSISHLDGPVSSAEGQAARRHSQRGCRQALSRSTDEASYAIIPRMKNERALHIIIAIQSRVG
jgi:hypothetical protein